MMINKVWNKEKPADDEDLDPASRKRKQDMTNCFWDETSQSPMSPIPVLKCGSKNDTSAQSRELLLLQKHAAWSVSASKLQSTVRSPGSFQAMVRLLWLAQPKEKACAAQGCQKTGSLEKERETTTTDSQRNHLLRIWETDTIILSHTWGKRIFSYKLNSNNYQWKTSSVATAVYVFVQIQNSTGEKQSFARDSFSMTPIARASASTGGRQYQLEQGP